MLRWFEHSQVYHPDRVLTATGVELGRPFEDIWFTASDGVKLNGWFYPASKNAPHSRLAALFCHGNAGNIGDRLGIARALLGTGVSVFLFDYRGYGRSAGKPSEEGTYLDGQAAYHWLRQKRFANASIVPFGESLGGGIASELAIRERVGGLVLQSTFCSMTEIGAELFPWLPVRLIGSIKYDTCAKLPRLKVPVLIMHSRGDGLIAFHHAEKNLASGNEPQVFSELEGDPNDVLFDHSFTAGLERFWTVVENSSSSSSSSSSFDP